MRFCPLLLAASVLAVGSNAVVVRAEEMPDDAQRLIAAFEEDAEAMRFEAERKITEQRRELAKQLKTLQDRYTRAAKLDEAVAIRDYVRAIAEEVLPAEPAPSNVLGLQGQVGRAFYFKLTGNQSGSVYGTDVYTGDSSIATAAVHSGVLKQGEEGIVKVRVLPARNSYATSTRHGITSRQWGSYSISFSVEKVRDLTAAAAPKSRSLPTRRDEIDDSTPEEASATFAPAEDPAEPQPAESFGPRDE